MVSTSTFYFNNLFFFSCYYISNNIAQLHFQQLNTHIKPINPPIVTLNSSQFMLSTQLMIPNYPESRYLITGIVACSAITSRSFCSYTLAKIKSQNPERTL